MRLLHLTDPMSHESIDLYTLIFVVTSFVLSLAACISLIVNHPAGTLLHYEPRRPVPWGAVGAVLVGFFLLTVFSTQLPSHAAPEKDHAGQKTEAHANETPAASTAENIFASMFVEVVIVGGLVFIVAVFWHANASDLGLPRNLPQFGRDLVLGALAGYAALAPVHIIQAVLAYLLNSGEESGHPLVKMIVEYKSNSLVFWVAAVMAVVIAPVCEEVTFRLLFQGWLEKLEDQWSGWRSPPELEPIPIENADESVVLTPVVFEQDERAGGE